jgi:hypothetical protein
MLSPWTPSIVPNGVEDTVYLVVDCYGQAGGCVWREAQVGSTDLETVITDLMAGQYSDPFRVVAFNTAERWSEDVSKDVAREIRRRADLAYDDLSSTVEAFVEMYVGHERQLALRFA